MQTTNIAMDVFRSATNADLLVEEYLAAIAGRNFSPQDHG